MPWTLRSESLSFVESAPDYFLVEGELDAPPERVFAVFADVASWATWFDDMKKGEWTGNQQGGVGATRKMTLGLVAADETILAWDPGKRFAFRIDTLTLPLVRAMVEDYQLEARPNNKSYLRWKAVYEPTLLTRILHPIVRMIFGRQFQRTLVGLRGYLAVNRG